MKATKKKRKQHRRQNHQNSGPIFVKHPFADIPKDILSRRLVELGEAHSKQFQENLETILSIIKSFNPLQTIAMLSAYGITFGINENGEHSPLHKDKQFSQSHVELLQALYLQIANQDIVFEPSNPDVIQNLFDKLPELSISFALQRLVNIEKVQSKEEKSIQLLQEKLRLHTQVVRNWGYFGSVIHLIKKLYLPLDQIYAENIGITAAKIINLFEYILRKTEHQINIRWRMLRKTFAEENVERMVKRYYELNPHLKAAAEDLISYANLHRLSLEQMKVLILLSYSDLYLSDAFTFNSSLIAKDLDILPEPIENILKKLSYCFGDLASYSIDQIMIDNPVWRKPLISMGQGNYFCPIPAIFFSFIYSAFNELIKDNNKLKQVTQDRRAQFLENEITELFSSAFPDCEILTGFKWPNGGNEYENDLIIRIDSHLLLVEAKSGAVSWPALRGAPDRMKRQIEDLVYAPSCQSKRLADQIKAVLKMPELQNSCLPGLTIKLDKVRTVLRLSVTLEDFGTIQTNLQNIKDTGWIPIDHALAPCIILSDLKIVFEILDSIGQKIHYLRRRTELAENMWHAGDEMDLLGLYLSTGFNLGDLEFNGTPLIVTGMYREIDQYFVALSEGINPKYKPKLKLTQWWQNTCAALEKRCFHQWTNICNILLSISPDEQREAEELFKKIKNNVRQNWTNPDHRSSIIYAPNKHRSDAIALYAFRDVEKDKHKDRMANIASQVFDQPHIQRCIVFGINIDKENGPYTTLMIFFREENQLINKEGIKVY